MQRVVLSSDYLHGSRDFVSGQRVEWMVLDFGASYMRAHLLKAFENHLGRPLVLDGLRRCEVEVESFDENITEEGRLEM